MNLEDSVLPQKESRIVSVVTGANGFVGSHLVDFLLTKGHHVKCVVRKSSNLQWLENKPIELCDCGLTDVEALKEVFSDADYIFHIAGVVKALRTEGFMKGNVAVTKTVLEAALSARHLKKLLITSSMAATGPSKKGGQVNEDSALNPIEPYGYSKVEQERLAKSYADRIPLVIVRPPAVYGPRDPEILPFFKAMQKGWFVRMGLDNKELSLIYVSDLVYGMFLAATASVSIGKTYFLGSTTCYSWKQVGEITAEILQRGVKNLAIPHWILFTAGAVGSFLERYFKMDVDLNLDRARRITRPSWYCSSEKAVKELGYEQRVSLKDGLQKTIDWYQEAGWLK